jgi:hypothetical protein
MIVKHLDRHVSGLVVNKVNRALLVDYSAVGFFVYLAETGTDPWQVIIPIGAAFVSSGNSMWRAGTRRRPPRRFSTPGFGLRPRMRAQEVPITRWRQFAPWASCERLDS